MNMAVSCPICPAADTIFSFLFIVEQHIYISFKVMLVHCRTLMASPKAGYRECPQKPWVYSYPCWVLSYQAVNLGVLYLV